MDVARENATIDKHACRESSRGRVTHMLQRGKRNPTRGAASIRGLSWTEEAAAATSVKAGTRLMAFGREVTLLLPEYNFSASHTGVSKDQFPCAPASGVHCKELP